MLGIIVIYSVYYTVCYNS